MMGMGLLLVTTEESHIFVREHKHVKMGGEGRKDRCGLGSAKLQSSGGRENKRGNTTKFL